MKFDVLVFYSSARERRLSDKPRNKRGRTITFGQADNICDHHVKHVKLESDSGVSQKRRPMSQLGNNNSHDHVRQSKLEAAAASPASERPYFTTTITLANCRRRPSPYLNIPKEFWLSNDILTEEPTVALRDPLKRIWTVKLRLQRRDRRLSIGRGWFEFYEGNKLEIGDVCVFELNSTSLQSPCPLLDVWTVPPPKQTTFTPWN